MQNLKPIRIATQGVAKDFSSSLFPAIVKSLGYDPVWSKPNLSDLIIIGPFWEPKKHLIGFQNRFALFLETQIW